MTDRELLEKAAKAAGVKGEWSTTIGGWPCLITGPRHSVNTPWQPLHDDGDAFRLAVKLGIEPYRLGSSVVAGLQTIGPDAEVIQESFDAHVGDPYAATRRAIVRAAASIGPTP